MLRAYPLQTHEMLFDAHNHAFAVLGGVPRRGIYDNMKTAVDKVGRGKARDVNARFPRWSSHYLFEAEFCNPAAGWEKGQIEKNVQDARHRLWHDVPTFADLDALNDWLQDAASRCGADPRIPSSRTARSPRCGQDERAAADADAAAVRRLRRAHQARLADLPGARSSAIATACRPRSPTGR